MYVLARHIGEEILIADIIRIKLLSVTGNTARLGIEAPKEISVKRVVPDSSSSGNNETNNKD